MIAATRSTKLQFQFVMQKACFLFMCCFHPSFGLVSYYKTFLLHALKSTSPIEISSEYAADFYIVSKNKRLKANKNSDSNDAKNSVHTFQSNYLIQKLASEFRGESVSEVRRILARKGIAYDQEIPNICDTNQLAFIYKSDFEKVLGCMSTVYIRAVFFKKSSSSNNIGHTWYVHHIEGTSDAVVSRGMLSCVSEIIRSVDLEYVLELDPATVADVLGLRSALSIGRNDGLASMIRTIQRQVLRHKSIIDCETIIASVENSTDEVNSSVLGKDDPSSQEKTRLSKSVPCKTILDRKETVALLLSGGVDSSVALCLLLEKGYDVTAFYLRIWLEDELSHLGVCPWEDDYQTCIDVCNHVSERFPSVKLETLSLQKDYHQRVVQFTVNEARSGRTPNPDILCNSRIKFGCFYDAIKGRNFDYIATGHYAQVERNNATGSVKLLAAPDPVKDQTYFLCALSQTQLQQCLFPIGNLRKSQVRRLAETYHLPNRNRPDSQGLCFLGKIKFDKFLENYLGSRPGPIIDASTGELLGKHNGIWFHTVGQRKGIGKVLNPQATSRGPWYVVAKNPYSDTLYCSNQYNDDAFTAPRTEIYLENIHWISGLPSKMIPLSSSRDNDIVYNLRMKVRHGPNFASGTLTIKNRYSKDGKVTLDEKDGGLAPGQYIVFYDCDDVDDPECLGGGIISEKHWTEWMQLNQNRSFYCGTV